jgi:hypothetical protein
VPNYHENSDTVFLYNSNFTYLLRFEDYQGQTYTPIAIVDLATLQVTMVSDPIFPKSCRLEFGPENTNFIGQKEPLMNSGEAVLDLKTGKVAYGPTP